MYQIGEPVRRVQKIRDAIDYPIIDADAHVIEARFALHDFVKQIAGTGVLKAFEARQSTRNKTSQRNGYWASPSGEMTIDRATVMLPGLYYARLAEAGIDFAIIYTSEGLGAQQVRDPELRQTLHRALNMLYADMFGPYADRMTASAVIPMHSPEEALVELDFAVNELGLKTVSIPGEWRGPVPEVAEAMPELADKTQKIHSFTIDSEMDYDPFWQRCVDLGVAITGHGGSQSTARRMSPDNFVYNRLGSFGVGNEHLCRSMFMGGVTRRFPTLNFGFLEGGVGWASALYNDLCEFWGKRNIDYLKNNMDPLTLNMELMVEMFEKYGNEYLTPERIAVRENADNLFSFHWEDERSLDDFRFCRAKKEEDIRDLFVPNFYFGCEADDRMNAVAFNRALNHFDVKLKALFSSDIGHWDVPDIRLPVAEAHDLVDAGLMTDDDFRAFIFKNVAELHVQMNPNFFKGTVVESAVQNLVDDGEIVLPDHSASQVQPPAAE
ncbi:amidohydrolase family protein [Alphaproteobacteria bacterium]|nr:amidohydrolase family protein [Alphaproteobacteria bacterium]